MSITLIIGPMFSGKTSELIRLVERKRIAGKKCLIIKNLRDDRYDRTTDDVCHVTTHDSYVY
jgi:thymidine kinase